VRGGLDLSDLELSPRANMYEQCNKPPNSMRGNECQLFKKKPAPEFVTEKPDKTRLKLFKIMDCKTGYL